MPSFIDIVRQAWNAYDPSRQILEITDISARVSTNHVYKIDLSSQSFVIAKLSYFGLYKHFIEDHRIINVLANNLPSPFENFLARSLMKGEKMFDFRYQGEGKDAWVVFYNPVKINSMLPRRLSDHHIIVLGEQMARFHKICTQIRHTLPESSKTLQTDVENLLGQNISNKLPFDTQHKQLINQHCEYFLLAYEKLAVDTFARIPVFVDWNIGNFSLTPGGQLFSRWDYDWFRMSSRILDFYFMSRVVSDIGDRTVFTYNLGPLMEERFSLFLQAYHQIFPLSTEEVLFIKEAYRFFLLNYVIKYGQYFFQDHYAKKLQKEVLQEHLPSLEGGFKPNKILQALDL